MKPFTSCLLPSPRHSRLVTVVLRRGRTALLASRRLLNHRQSDVSECVLFMCCPSSCLWSQDEGRDEGER